jgi:hypothetical protein
VRDTGVPIQEGQRRARSAHPDSRKSDQQSPRYLGIASLEDKIGGKASGAALDLLVQP